MNLMIWGGSFLFAAGFVTSPWLTVAGLALFAAGGMRLIWSLLE